MCDIVANRRRLSLGDKFRLFRTVLRQNGIWWTAWLGGYYFASMLADRAFARMEKLRVARGVPGINSLEINRDLWNHWNWIDGGEEWTASEEWKRAVIERAIHPYCSPGANVLEIGPGGGRWTEALLERAGTLVAIDISEAGIEHCRARFVNAKNARFMVGDGRSLPGVEDRSIDFVWTFDVFVHINLEDVVPYVAEIARVLRPGGLGVLHHGTEGGRHGRWRSNLTAAALDQNLRERDFELVERFSSWTIEGSAFEIGTKGDAISVVRKNGPPR